MSVQPLIAGFVVGVLASAGSVARAAAPESLSIESVVLRPIVEAEAPARQTGVLARLAANEGDAVRAGDVLAALDDRLARLAVQKAATERDQARAQVDNDLRIRYADKALAVARAEMQRSLESNQQFPNSISQSQLDVERLTVEKLELERQQAQRDLESARFDLRLKETALEAAQLELELSMVRAPFDGVVALVRGRQGEWVEPGTPVLRLVAVDALRAEGFASADALERLRVGAAVRFLPSSGGDFAGKLGFIGPEIDPVTRQVRVWAEVANAERRLRPGQQGRLEIEFAPAAAPPEGAP